MTSSLSHLPSCSLKQIWSLQLGSSCASDSPVSVTHTMFKVLLHIGSSLTIALLTVSANLTRVCIVKHKCHTHKYKNIWFQVKRVRKWVLCLKSASWSYSSVARFCSDRFSVTCNTKSQIVHRELEQRLSFCHNPGLSAQFINILEKFFLSLNIFLVSSPACFTTSYSGVQAVGDILIGFRFQFTVRINWISPPWMGPIY